MVTQPNCLMTERGDRLSRQPCSTAMHSSGKMGRCLGDLRGDSGGHGQWQEGGGSRQRQHAGRGGQLSQQRAACACKGTVAPCHLLSPGAYNMLHACMREGLGP